MPVLISSLLGFFSSVGAFAKFFLWIGKKVTLTSLILPIQITFIGTIIVFRVSLVTSFITLILFIYNQFTDLMSYINTSFSSDYLTIPYKILQSMGVIDALSDFYSVFTVVFVSLLIALLSKLAMVSLRELSDEFYKIGVLLQLGIK